ncbi:MAG: ATP-binding protein, partial [Oscillospiraceae bacterium]
MENTRNTRIAENTQTIKAIKTFKVRNQPKGEALWQSIGGNFCHFGQVLEELVDNALSNYNAHNADSCLSREVRITLEDQVDTVYATVEDGGSGISNIHNAMTMAGFDAPDTLLNEHGFGLKHALATANPGNNDWMIYTRTEEDRKENCFQRLTAPYQLESDGYSGAYYPGWDGTLGGTGTMVQFACSLDMFQTLREGKPLPGDTFQSLLPCLQEELGFTYGPLLKENRLRIRLLAVNADGTLLSDHLVQPVEPEWEEERALPAVRFDLGGGEVEIACTYGQILPTVENNRYYRGNIPSSGVEIRINGRAVVSGLFKEIWKREKHNSQNLFLAQIDLRTTNAAAVPATRTAKNGFREGEPLLEALYAWIRTTVPRPNQQTAQAVERGLLAQLAEIKERTLDQPHRVSLEENTYCSLNEKIRMDLFTNESGHATVYEGKKDATAPRDVYQLRMYWDGCVVDGIPVEDGVLIASRHSEGVRKLVEITNRMCGPDGRPYHFRLETWRDVGVAYPP